MTTQSADAALIALAGQLMAAWAVEKVAVDSQPDTPEGEAASKAITAVPASIVDRIEAIPATTFAGLGAKAVALAWTQGDYPSELEHLRSRGQASGETTDQRVMASLARDIAAIGKSLRRP
jgi:hypothetical protein